MNNENTLTASRLWQRCDQHDSDTIFNLKISMIYGDGNQNSGCFCGGNINWRRQGGKF